MAFAGALPPYADFIPFGTATAVSRGSWSWSWSWSWKSFYPGGMFNLWKRTQAGMRISKRFERFWNGSIPKDYSNPHPFPGTLQGNLRLRAGHTGWRNRRTLNFVKKT